MGEIAKYTPTPWYREHPNLTRIRECDTHRYIADAPDRETAAFIVNERDAYIDLVDTANAHASNEAKIKALVEAGEALLEHYVALVNSGDAGTWDPESENEVSDLRAAIEKAGTK